jgi:hypothetical protein
VSATVRKRRTSVGTDADGENAHKQDLISHFVLGVRPGDELEGMHAAQLLASHNAKLVTPLERSTVRPTYHGPGSFFVCAREVNPPSDTGTTRRTISYVGPRFRMHESVIGP